MCDEYFNLVFASDQRRVIGTKLFKFIDNRLFWHKVMPSKGKLDLSMSVLLSKKFYYLKA